MGFYDDMQGIASDLLREFSQSTSEDGTPKMKYVELIAAGGPVDNPGVPTETVHDIIGGVARGVDEMYVDGSQVIASNGQITCEVGTFEPKAKDYVILNGKRHKVTKAVNLPATGVPVAYVIIYER